MKRVLALVAVIGLLRAPYAVARDEAPCILFDASYGECLRGSTREVGLWWASSGWKVSKTRLVPRKRGNALDIRAACNEAEAAQFVVSPQPPGAGLKGFLATPGALTGPGGATIPTEHVDVLRVRYVDIAQRTDKSGVEAPWPDPLPPFQGPIDLVVNENHPFWVRVYVPKDTPPGVYTGAIRLTADGYEAAVPLDVQVYGFELPDRMTCSTAFGFNPSTVWQYQKVADPQQRREVLEKYWESFRAHRISPYAPAPLDGFKVEWVKLTPDDGAGLPEADRKLLEEHPLTPRFDWSAWDAEVDRVMSKYHFNSFRLGMPGLGGGTFYGHSAQALHGFAGDTRGFELAFTAYAQALEAHLRDKGWLDEAFVYWFDEPAPRDYPHVLDGFLKLKEAAPGLRRMITDRAVDGLIGGPQIWCPVTWKYFHEETLERRKVGEVFWWYVCTGPKAPFPGLFIDHAATDLRAWLWQTWMYDIRGILVWTSNLWTTGTAYPDRPQNPYEDPMAWMSGYGTKKGEKKPWGNGDGRFLYPPEAAADANPPEPILEGPVDSIRWEMLRDGLEDYEYMVILKRLLADKTDRLSERKLRRCERLLEVPKQITSDRRIYTKDPAPIEKHRHRVAKAIEELTALD